MNHSALEHHRRDEESQQDRDSLFIVRNTLNIIFMLGAVIGVALYYSSDKTIGAYVVLAAIVVKMAECCLRFFRR